MKPEWSFDDYGHWVGGNLVLEDKTYIYEVLLTPFPTKFGIFTGRIVQLHLYDETDCKIAEYDRQWILGPEKGTDGYKVVGKILKEYNFRKKGTKVA